MAQPVRGPFVLIIIVEHVCVPTTRSSLFVLSYPTTHALRLPISFVRGSLRVFHPCSCMATRCAHLALAIDHVRLQGKAFSRWEHYAADRKRVKARAYRVIIKIKGSSAARAWGTWSQAVEGSRRAGTNSVKPGFLSCDIVPGVSVLVVGEGKGACAWKRMG